MRHPILTIKILIILIGQLIKATFNYVIHHIILILALVSAIVAFYQAPGPHEQVSIYLDINLQFDIYLLYFSTVKQ